MGIGKILEKITGKEELEKELENRTHLIQKMVEEHRNEVAEIRTQLEETEEKLRQYEEDYNNVSEFYQNIQREFLLHIPREIGAVSISAGYEAVRGLTSDFYGVLHRKNKLLIFIADVSGHSLLSTSMGFMLNYFMRVFYERGCSILDILHKLNDIFLKYVPSSDYFSLFVVELDVYTFMVKYVSAGHQPMIVYRAEKDDVELLNTKGLFVGAMETDEVEYECADTILEPGDRIVLYTKGVIEQLGDGDIEKGEEELKRIVIDNKDLPIKDLISDVFRRFSNREVLKDDVAMLSVEISPNYTDFINLVKRANESFDVGEYEKGLDLLEEAYHILPGYKDILIQLAKAAFNIKDYEKAREYIDEYMEFFPDDPEGYYLLAKIERKLGNKDKALSFAQKSIEIDKNYLKGIVFTAICYNDIGDKINSLRYLKIAYTLNPMDTKIKAMIEKLQREI